MVELSWAFNFCKIGGARWLGIVLTQARLRLLPVVINVYRDASLSMRPMAVNESDCRSRRRGRCNCSIGNGVITRLASRIGSAVLEVTGLTRAFGVHVAIADVSLQVA